MALPARADLPSGSYVSHDGASGKWTLGLSPGTRALSAPLELGIDCAGVVGISKGAILTWAGAGPAIKLNDGTGFDGEIRDIRINATGSASYGIEIGQTSTGAKSAQALISNVEIRGPGGTNTARGINVLVGQICMFRDVRIYACDIGWCWSDDYYDSHAQIGNVACVVSGGRVESCRIGAKVEAAYLLTYDGTVFQHQSEEAVYAVPTVHAVKQFVARDCYFESNNENRATGPYGQLHFGLGCIAKIDRGLFRQVDVGGNYHVTYTSTVTSVDIGTGVNAPFVNDATGRTWVQV